jgi:hypothetical protein
MPSAQGYKTSYPELPFTIPPPPPNALAFTDAIKILSAYPDKIGKAVFALMVAEARKNETRTAFLSPGGNNFGGIQTDAGRWGAPGITGQYAKVDSGGKLRSFAIFPTAEAFLNFTANRVEAKGFDGTDGKQWTKTYINKWWSPVNKAQFVEGTQTFNNKLAIYNAASKIYDQVKNTLPQPSIINAIVSNPTGTPAIKKKRRRVIIGASLLALAIGGGVWYYRRRKRKNVNQ